MPSEPAPPSFAEVVHRAAELCDPSGEHPTVWDLVSRLEDRDEPVTSVADIAGELAETTPRVEPAVTDPALELTAAVAVYLAHRRDQMDAAREDVLRLAARAEFDGDPPPEIADWLEAEGVSP
jgi:hypothetical protein